MSKYLCISRKLIYALPIQLFYAISYPFRVLGVFSLPKSESDQVR